MLSSKHEQLLTTLLELRPEGSLLALIVSPYLGAGGEILEWLRARFSFEAVDVIEGSSPLAPGDNAGPRRFIHGLPLVTAEIRRAFLTALNRGRDRIESLSLQLVLWIHTDDLGEFFSLAPDLASWVDEVLEWEGEPELRELYALPSAVPKAVEELVEAYRASSGPLLRSRKTLAPFIWVGEASVAQVDPGRVADLVDEIELAGNNPLILPRRSLDHLALQMPRFGQLTTIDASMREVPQADPEGGPRTLPRTRDLAALCLSTDDSVLYLRGVNPGGFLDLSGEEAGLRRQYGTLVASASGTSVSDLMNALTEYPASILQFSGLSQTSGLLMQEGEDFFPLHPQTFRRVLYEAGGTTHFKCIILNTCWSSGLAAELIEEPALVSSAIAVSGDVEDRVALSFSREFHHALSTLKSIPRSFERAMEALQVLEDTRPPYVLMLSQAVS